MDEDALANATIRRFQHETMTNFASKNDFERSFGPGNEPVNQMTGKEAEILDILANIRAYAGQKTVIERLRELA
jgi:hypothetical protein